MSNRTWLRLSVGTSLFFVLAGPVAAALDAWCAHVTSVAGWKTTISFYNAGFSTVTVTAARYGSDGNPYGALLLMEVPPLAWASFTPLDLGYNGTAHLTAPADLDVKLTYQFGDSPSVCEFFLTGETAQKWMLPNTVRSWMDYTGVALMNPLETAVNVTLEAWLGGSLVTSVNVTIPARGQYLRLSDGIWTGTPYTGFDTIRIFSNGPIPAPIDITGNVAGDRHLFFGGRPVPIPSAGDLVGPDALVGNLRYIPAGTFTQGSPPGEPCAFAEENQFFHTLSQGLALMETEVTRQMWADLRTVQPTLPADPTYTSCGAGMNNPVQTVSWFEAVLFANLLSLANGRTRCYYADAGFTQPITADNYLAGPVYCNWNVTGYRLPTEGEWEYACRAGTTTPFYVVEPNYSSANCLGNSTAGMYPHLETVAWFSANTSLTTHEVGQKTANAWKLRDMHGNVGEWCWDWYGLYPTGSASDHPGAASGIERVIRGGGFGNVANYCRAAYRGAWDPDEPDPCMGFRLARSTR
ncbi:MAG: formylglycine-generating enzyme family protein [Acidobacteria bacterium]|nr:formylglycine-generating enzyme family protein [Acidobacteriota bacterium]